MLPQQVDEKVYAEGTEYEGPGSCQCRCTGAASAGALEAQVVLVTVTPKPQAPTAQRFDSNDSPSPPASHDSQVRLSCGPRRRAPGRLREHHGSLSLRPAGPGAVSRLSGSLA